jgi:ribosomal protein S11
MQKHNVEFFYNLQKKDNKILLKDLGYLSKNFLLFKKFKIKKKQKRIAFLFYIDMQSKNIRISLLNGYGKVLFQYSAGHAGLKKSQRKGNNTGRLLLSFFLLKLQKLKIKDFCICFKGYNFIRRFFINYFIRRFLKNKKCSYLLDLTTLQHGGCRLRSFRRL